MNQIFFKTLKYSHCLLIIIIEVGGLDLPKSLDLIKQLQLEQLDREKRTNYGGGKSSIVLMIINMAVISDSDLRFSLDQLNIIYEQIPG